MRITTVNSARKDQGPCESCREPITKGQGYRWLKSRYGPKRSRHTTCPSWRPSEMTGSKMATAYAAQEGGHDDLDALGHDDVTDADTAQAFIDAIKAALEGVAQGATECAADYEEGISNLPDSLQDGPTAEESREKIDALESWAQELEGWEPDSDSSDWTDMDDDVERAQAIDAWCVEASDSARQVIDGLEY